MIFIDAYINGLDTFNHEAGWERWGNYISSSFSIHTTSEMDIMFKHVLIFGLSANSLNRAIIKRGNWSTFYRHRKFIREIGCYGINDAFTF